MKAVAKIFVVLLLFALSSCSSEVDELRVDEQINSSNLQLNSNGDDDDIDCKGVCDD